MGTEYFSAIDPYGIQMSIDDTGSRQDGRLDFDEAPLIEKRTQLARELRAADKISDRSACAKIASHCLSTQVQQFFEQLLRGSDHPRVASILRTRQHELNQVATNIGIGQFERSGRHATNTVFRRRTFDR